MKRRALIATLVPLALCGRVAAHGPVPAATEQLIGDDAGSVLVRLTPGGFAFRRPDGFQFVCPEAFGLDVSAPAAAMPSGPAIVASDTLWVLEASGDVSAHALQSANGKRVAAQRDAVFGVFEPDAGVELRRITRSANDLVRTLDASVDSLSASDDEVALLRYTGRTIVVERMSLLGESRGSVTWTAATEVADAQLRAAGSDLYVVTYGQTAPWVTLGRIDDSSYVPLREANVDIAGPVASPEGTWVAVDGVLRDLSNDSVLDGTGTHLSCLGETGGAAYACARGDLVGVDASGLGGTRFDMNALLGPNVSSLSDTARSSCNVRWLDLQIDLQASQPHMDAGIRTDAAAPTPGDASPSATSESGCSAGGSSIAPSWALLLVARFRRRRSLQVRAQLT